MFSRSTNYKSNSQGQAPKKVENYALRIANAQAPISSGGPVVISKPTTQTPPPKPASYKPTPKPNSEKPLAKPVIPQDIFKYVLEMKFMSVEQMRKRFPDFKEEQVEKLVSEGLLKKVEAVNAKTTILVGTERCYEVILKESGDKKVPQAMKRIFQPSVNHDLKLVDLRMKFEELNFIERWYSEKMLQEVPLFLRVFQDLPDAVCRKKNKKSYFLELEISGKSGPAYAERIAEYERVLKLPEIEEAGIEGVIFLCTDEKVAEVIRGKLPDNRAFSVLPYSRYVGGAV